jgi:hypothetical protein
LPWIYKATITVAVQHFYNSILPYPCHNKIRAAANIRHGPCITPGNSQSAYIVPPMNVGLGMKRSPSTYPVKLPVEAISKPSKSKKEKSYSFFPSFLMMIIQSEPLNRHPSLRFPVRNNCHSCSSSTSPRTATSSCLSNFKARSV